MINTCGSEGDKSYEYVIGYGLDYFTTPGVDTILEVYERVSGPITNMNVNLADFALISSNDDAGAHCTELGEDGEGGDSVLLEALFADVQYIILVVSGVMTTMCSLEGVSFRGIGRCNDKTMG